jgi:hypothetical protein
MTIKVTYNTTDIYVSESISATYINVSYEVPTDSGGGVWGDITGTLSDQTDLQNALNAKFDDPTGTTAQYLRGDGSLATFPTIPSGTVTSVGLTMPSAFSVAGSPVTSSGTLAVTGVGTAAQYIRGDGQLANFPDNQGGGSSVNYYLNGSVTQGTFGGDTYYEMSKTPVLGAGTNFTRTNAQGNGYIASFITDAGDPSLLNIPGGNWNVEFYFQSSSTGGSPQFYAELYKVDASNNFTLVGSGSTNPEGITNGTTVDQYYTSIPVPQTSLLVTDRLAIRIFVIPSGRTITLHTENSNLCEVLTTLSTGLNALNALTAQVQYFATGTSGTDFAISSATDTHTFNLPTASATNRGALSSADWTTFNSKQNALTNPITGTAAAGQVAYFTGSTTQAGSNNLFWDNTNGRLGIGTNAPTTTLQVNGASTFNQRINLLAAAQSNPTGGSSIAIDYQSTSDLQGRIRSRDWDAGVWKNITYAGLNHTFETNSNTRFIINDVGRVLIGSTTDSGQRLQVTGDTLLKGSGNTSGTTALTVQNSASANAFRVLNDGQINLGNSASFPLIRTVTEASVSTQAIAGTKVLFISQDTETGSGASFAFASNTITHTSGNLIFSQFSRDFTPTSGTGTATTLRIGGTINQTGGANGITRGLYVQPTLTAAADWRSIEWSNNTGWGLYGSGTATNYLGGALTIGSTLAFGKLYVGGNTGGGYSDGTYVYSQAALNGNITNFYNFRSSIVPTGTVSITNVFQYAAQQSAIGTTTITNQYGFHVASSLVGATNNFGFYGDIPSGTNRWNLYMNGTASNFLNGSLSIQTTASTRQITLSGTGTNVGVDLTNSSGSVIYSTYRVLNVGTDNSTIIGSVSNNNFLLYSNNTERARFTNTGNLLIGSTTDSGEKLQVTGTAKITGASSFGSDMTIIGSGTTNGTLALLVRNSSSTNILGAYNDRTVFIGSASGSSHALEVNATANATRIAKFGNFEFVNNSNASWTGVGISVAGANRTLTFLPPASSALNASDTVKTLFTTQGGVWARTSGNAINVQISDTQFAPTSGTAAYYGLYITGGVNQTGGASGISRGLYIDYNIVAAADFRAIEVSSGGAYINTTSVQASAILQADSTTKGFLPPRMTNAQRTAISSPAVGLIVYCTDMVEGLYVYKSTGWTFII